MPYQVAGMDIHKNVLMVVVARAAEQVDDPIAEALEFQCRRFGTGAQERAHLAAWLRERGVTEVVMESTAQYWKPVWLDLEPHVPKLHLAQAQSNRAPKGRKNDFRDAKRLARRLLAGELMLSFVPDAEQRMWRTLTRSKHQLVRDRVRLQNQVEALLEEMRIKLSGVISDLLGVSGRRILAALAQGETDAEQLAELGDERLRCSRAELADALRGAPQPAQLAVLKLFLARLALLDQQIESLDTMAAEELKTHEDAVIRNPRLRCGFGATAHCRSGRGGAGLPLGRPVLVVVWRVSGVQRERRAEPEFPVAERQPVCAAPADASGASGGEEEGLSVSDGLSPVIAAAGL
jgi:transposase